MLKTKTCCKMLSTAPHYSAQCSSPKPKEYPKCVFHLSFPLPRHSPSSTPSLPLIRSGLKARRKRKLQKKSATKQTSKRSLDIAPEKEGAELFFFVNSAFHWHRASHGFWQRRHLASYGTCVRAENAQCVQRVHTHPAVVFAGSKAASIRSYIKISHRVDVRKFRMLSIENPFYWESSKSAARTKISRRVFCVCTSPF